MSASLPALVDPVPAPEAQLLAHADLNTRPMWLLALLPAIQVGLLVALTIAAALLASSGMPGSYPVAVALVSDWTTVATIVVAGVARVLLARADHRALQRLGVQQPMAWGWGLAGVVYLIGRGVVLHRRAGRGSMLTWIGLLVVVIAQIVDRSGVYTQLISIFAS